MSITVSVLKFASVGRWFETRFAACSSDDIRPYTKSVTDLIVGAVCVHLPTKSLYFGGFVSTMQKKACKNTLKLFADVGWIGSVGGLEQRQLF